MNSLDDLQPTLHPLKWRFLLNEVERSDMEDPDVWIEDLRRYGACMTDGKENEPILVCKDEDTDGVEASFSVITDKKNNRIIIRHHY